MLCRLIFCHSVNEAETCKQLPLSSHYEAAVELCDLGVSNFIESSFEFEFELSVTRRRVTDNSNSKLDDFEAL